VGRNRKIWNRTSSGRPSLCRDSVRHASPLRGGLKAHILLDEQAQGEEGPIKMIDPEKVPKEPSALLEGFEWVTMDLSQNSQVR
jgi:hypothetical protein